MEPLDRIVKPHGGARGRVYWALVLLGAEFYHAPAVLVQLVSFMRHRTLASAVLLAAALAATVIWSLLSVEAFRSKGIRRLIADLEKKPDWGLKPLSFEHLLTDKAAELLTNPLTGEPNAVLLQVVPHGDTGLLNPTALETFGGPTYLLLPDNMEGRRGAGLYGVLHELGHATKAAAFARDRSVHALVTTVSALLWTGLVIRWSLVTVGLWAALSCLLLLLRRVFDLRSNSGRLTAEVCADRFAFEQLSASDLASTMSYFEKYPSSHESLFSKEENHIRHEQRKSAAAKLASGEKLDLMQTAIVPVQIALVYMIVLILIGLLPQDTSRNHIIAVVTAGVLLPLAVLIWSVHKDKATEARAAELVSTRTTSQISEGTSPERTLDMDMAALAEVIQHLKAVTTDQAVEKMMAKIMEETKLCENTGKAFLDHSEFTPEIDALRNRLTLGTELAYSCIDDCIRGSGARGLLKLCERALVIAERRLSANDPVLGILLHVIALTSLCLRRRFRGHYFHNRSLKILRSSGIPDVGTMIPLLKREFVNVRRAVFYPSQQQQGKVSASTD